MPCMGAAVTNPWCTPIEKHLPTPLQTVSNPTSHIHKFLHEGAQGICNTHRFFLPIAVRNLKLKARVQDLSKCSLLGTVKVIDMHVP